MEDAEALSALARDTFYETFAPSNDPGDMALHLQRAFGVPQQSAELSDPTIVTLIVENDGAPVGYAQVRAAPAPACVTGPDPTELWRFYVARGWHGRGIAQDLMLRVKEEAVGTGARTLWLGVWEKNPRARAFYLKCGFVDVGDHVFLFGTDRQTDLVMALPLTGDRA